MKNKKEDKNESSNSEDFSHTIEIVFVFYSLWTFIIGIKVILIHLKFNVSC